MKRRQFNPHSKLILSPTEVIAFGWALIPPLEKIYQQNLIISYPALTRSRFVNFQLNFFFLPFDAKQFLWKSSGSGERKNL